MVTTTAKVMLVLTMTVTPMGTPINTASNPKVDICKESYQRGHHDGFEEFRCDILCETLKSSRDAYNISKEYKKMFDERNEHGFGTYTWAKKEYEDNLKSVKKFKCRCR